MKFPEQYRLQPPGFPKSLPGESGIFLIDYRHYSPITLHKKEYFRAIASDGEGWEHVSVALINQGRCPTWAEMCFIKNLFWDEDRCVVQYHPAKKDYVNQHPYCLHLWRPNDGRELPVPDPILVGMKKEAAL